MTVVLLQWYFSSIYFSGNPGEHFTFHWKFLSVGMIKKFPGDTYVITKQLTGTEIVENRVGALV